MHPVDIEESLESLTILVDTREQPSERAKKRYSAFQCPYRRQKLDYGDYSAEVSVSNKEVRLPVVIERKMSLDELAMCFGRERARFEREFERAASDNAKIYLLVENATWENLINGKYRSKLNAKAFYSSVTAWMARYNMSVIFCKEDTSGKMIREILYREAKEWLVTQK